MRSCRLLSLLLPLSRSLFLLAGCQAAHHGMTTGTVRAFDGVPIVYDVRGHGDTALVFVHCWCCNREFWREQLDALADDCRVVSLDLPGHGESVLPGHGDSVLPGHGESVLPGAMPKR